MAVTSTLKATVNALDQVSQGLRVEAWDAAGICRDLIDVAITDPRGQFEMSLRDAILAALPQRPRALPLRLFRDGRWLAQEHETRWQLGQRLTSLQISLRSHGSERSDEAPAPAVIRGNVRRRNGTPVGEVDLRAFDQALTASGVA